MIIKRRLGILGELIDEFHLKLRVIYVPSEKNKADVLTRVKKVPEDPEEEVAMVCCSGAMNLKEMHHMHHMGVDRTLFLTRKIDRDVTREAVGWVVRSCDR